MKKNKEIQNKKDCSERFTMLADKKVRSCRRTLRAVLGLQLQMLNLATIKKKVRETMMGWTTFTNQVQIIKLISSRIFKTRWMISLFWMLNTQIRKKNFCSKVLNMKIFKALIWTITWIKLMEAQKRTEAWKQYKLIQRESKTCIQDHNHSKNQWLSPIKQTLRILARMEMSFN